jgi:hypothetical protein
MSNTPTMPENRSSDSNGTNSKTNGAADEVVIYEQPSGVIRQVIDEGFSLAAHITTDKIAACQAVINDASDRFFEEGFEDVKALRALFMDHAPETADAAFFKSVQRHATNLQGQSQVLGFTLITKISGHMIDSVRHPTMVPDRKFQLLSRITEVLKLAFTDRIRDAGGPKGVEMLSLIETYLASSAAKQG